MKKKKAYAIFTLTDLGNDYMVKGNFGEDKAAADKWAENHANDADRQNYDDRENVRYPNGLFVKEINY